MDAPTNTVSASRAQAPPTDPRRWRALALILVPTGRSLAGTRPHAR